MGTLPPGLQPNRVPVDKSPVLAFFLTLFFGPLGLLYVKVVPALVLILVAAAGYFTFGVTAIVAWIVSIVWAPNQPRPTRGDGPRRAPRDWPPAHRSRSRTMRRPASPTAPSANRRPRPRPPRQPVR